jgi:hypothetical protein
MNLGHYHAMFRRHDYIADSAEAKAFETKQGQLVQAQLALINYALRFKEDYRERHDPERTRQFKDSPPLGDPHLRSRLQSVTRSKIKTALT